MTSPHNKNGCCEQCVPRVVAHLPAEQRNRYCINPQCECHSQPHIEGGSERLEDLLHIPEEPLYLPEDRERLDGRASRWRNEVRDEIRNLLASDRTALLEKLAGEIEKESLSKSYPREMALNITRTLALKEAAGIVRRSLTHPSEKV